MTGRGQIEQHERDGVTVSVAVADRDRFAVVVDRIRVSRHDGGPLAPAAPQVVAAIDYLSEGLRVVEAAPADALVRSQQPVQTPEGRQYYEIRFEGPEATMERRQGAAGTVTAVPFTVTNGMLDRLVDDLGRLLGSAPPPPGPA